MRSPSCLASPLRRPWGHSVLGNGRPVSSGYGVHLVFVSARTEGRVPALKETRDAVRREWANVQQQHAQETFYQRLLKRYTIVVQQP